MRQSMKEYSIPKTVVIDNDQGIIAVELTTRIESLRVTEDARGMKKGDSRSFIDYFTRARQRCSTRFAPEASARPIC
jgi:hypothetical protein